MPTLQIIHTPAPGKKMQHESLTGLDKDRVIAIVEPVLRAHRVDGVELIWRNDGRGMLLYLTVERPGTTDPGAGVSIDQCADISRDLSAALDVAEVLTGSYRLEVGSPGLERALYKPEDYARFAGRTAKIKLKEHIEGQWVVRGQLHGLDEQGFVVIDADWGRETVDPALIESGQLVFEFGNKARNKAKARRRAGAGSVARASQRSK